MKKMSKITKILAAFTVILMASSQLFADPVKKTSVSSSDINVVQSLQNTFRSISETMLPAVVEVDVSETKTYTSPFGNMTSPWEYFFGSPNSKDDDSKKNQREYEQKGLGSGVIVRKTGNTFYVLTNNHVAGSATKISIKLNDNREFEGKLVGADERLDIALVSFETKDNTIPVASLGDSDKVQPGDICLAFGAPLGYSQSVTQGIVSAVGRSESHMSSVSDYIQTDAAINQGNSGGPLVNIYGEVIGINTWIASSSGGSQGLGFSLPINSLKKSIEDFISSGKITYGWLGVSLLDVKDEYKKTLGVDGKNGALASQIFLDSPGHKGGMQAGDFIIEVNGKKIKNQTELMREVGYLPAGKNAAFKVIRNGKTVDLTVKIEERTEKVTNDNSKLWPGFIASPLTDDVKKELGLEDSKVKGVAVVNVLEKSPAAAMRIQNGDIITAVNDKKVTNIQEFYDALNINGKREIWFDVYNDGHTLSTSHYKF